MDAHRDHLPNDEGFHRNVEIKARVNDAEAMQHRIEALAGRAVSELQQVDTFFCTPVGRLKLRQLAPHRGQLIYYERPDRASAKTSRYLLYETTDPAALLDLLTQALTPRGTVRKTRLLYRHDRTRIHLDRVDGLGVFLELEVVLSPDQSEREGRRTAARLCAALDIDESQCIERAYIDLIEDR
jgi:predicted adenylyl cyclase CyaB